MHQEDYFNKKKSIVEKSLRDLSFKGSNRAESAANYTLLSDGHRWRPILTLTLADEFDQNYEGIEKLVCSTEILHALSIILDDLPCMDNADVRRNQPTCHKVYGEASAILGAQLLQSLGQEVIIDYAPSSYKNYLLKRSINVGRSMARGQIADLENSANGLESVLKRYSDKSGELVGFASTLGVLEIESLRARAEQFGRDLGIAYQVKDDILDATSTTELTGKDVGKDSSITTVVSLEGLEVARSIMQKYKSGCLKFTEGREKLTNLVNRVLS